MDRVSSRLMLRACSLWLATVFAASGCSASPQSSADPAQTAFEGEVTIDARAAGAPISRDSLGVDLGAWYDVTRKGVANELRRSGFGFVRWPGGWIADSYHWRTHSLCGKGYLAPRATFDRFVSSVAKPANLDVGITLNYGTNGSCNGGGDPAEAAAWVEHAARERARVKYWTVGQEPYGAWDLDLHTRPHDADTYARSVATGYYPQIKAKDRNALVGVVADPIPGTQWNATVFSRAKFDFVELHYFAEAPGQENDAYLLADAPQNVAKAVADVRRDMTDANVPTTVPIVVGALSSVYANPGKQSTSIVQALYASMAVAELLKAGVTPIGWFMGHGSCTDLKGGANFSPQLYGWQNFGGFAIFSDGLPDPQCPLATFVPQGTPLPTARAFELLSLFAHDGEHMLPATVASSLPSVRAYGATLRNGYCVLLVNIDALTPAAFKLTISGTKRDSFNAVTTTYTKAFYDESRQGRWVPPFARSLGKVGTSLKVTVQPWSLTTLVLQ